MGIVVDFLIKKRQIDNTEKWNSIVWGVGNNKEKENLETL